MPASSTRLLAALATALLIAAPADVSASKQSRAQSSKTTASASRKSGAKKTRGTTNRKAKKGPFRAMQVVGKRRWQQFKRKLFPAPKPRQLERPLRRTRVKRLGVVQAWVGKSWDRVDTTGHAAVDVTMENETLSASIEIKPRKARRPDPLDPTDTWDYVTDRVDPETGDTLPMRGGYDGDPEPHRSFNFSAKVVAHYSLPDHGMADAQVFEFELPEGELTPSMKQRLQEVHPGLPATARIKTEGKLHVYGNGRAHLMVDTYVKPRTGFLSGEITLSETYSLDAP